MQGGNVCVCVYTHNPNYSGGKGRRIIEHVVRSSLYFCVLSERGSHYEALAAYQVCYVYQLS